MMLTHENLSVLFSVENKFVLDHTDDRYIIGMIVARAYEVY